MDPINLKATPCESCDSVHPATRNWEPRRWQCLKFPRLPGLDPVAPSERVVAEPYNLCRNINVGFCPVWTQRRDAEAQTKDDEPDEEMPDPDDPGIIEERLVKAINQASTINAVTVLMNSPETRRDLSSLSEETRDAIREHAKERLHTLGWPRKKQQA